MEQTTLKARADFNLNLYCLLYFVAQIRFTARQFQSVNSYLAFFFTG
jgi:hypothetical protein